MGIGAKLRAELDARGMSVAKLARLANVNPASIYSVLRRDSDKVNRDFIIKICAALQIPYERIIGRPLYDIVIVNIPESTNPATIDGSGITEQERKHIKLFRAASPELQAAAIAMLEAAEKARIAQDSSEAGKEA